MIMQTVRRCLCKIYPLWTSSRAGKSVVCLLTMLMAYTAYREYNLTVSVEYVSRLNQRFAVKNTGPMQVYTKRRITIRDVCQNSTAGNVEHVFVHNDTQIAYCPVAKSGCTFWKRIFRFLANDTGPNPVQTPFQIPRSFVHYGPWKNHAFQKYNISDENSLSNYSRFLFSRNPYTRLWSAYLDKFYLPDFWRSFARNVVKARKHVSEKAERCAHDVSFTEFLNYVVTHDVKGLNEHWKPIKYMCDPCLYKPNIIGKLETFSDDARYILNGIGREWIMNKSNSKSNDEEELNTIIDYNFQLINSDYYKECVSPQKLAKLLWNTFQMNGYLPLKISSESVVDKLNATILDKGAFKDLVLKTYTSATAEDRKKWKLQRKESLRDAFKNTSYYVVASIKKLFKDDFELFGYDVEPPM